MTSNPKVTTEVRQESETSSRNFLSVVSLTKAKRKMIPKNSWHNTDATSMKHGVNKSGKLDCEVAVPLSAKEVTVIAKKNSERRVLPQRVKLLVAVSITGGASALFVTKKLDQTCFRNGHKQF